MEQFGQEKEDLNRGSPLEEYFEPIEEAEDVRFGQIIILRNKYNNDELIFAKEKLSYNLHDCQRDIFQAKERMRLSHDFLLKMIDFSTKTFVGEEKDQPTQYLVSGFYEYPRHDLSIEIAERASQGRHFSAEELLGIEINILEVLNYLRTQKMVHGDIRPKYICYDQTGEGWHKLVDRLGDPSSPNQVQVNNIKRKENLYMSPALYRSLIQRQNKIKHNPYKSDAFSLGLVLLECGTLKSVQGIYRDKDIDMEQLLCLLEEFLAIYEENLMIKESLLWLLDTEEKDRKDPKKILKLLNEMSEEEQARLQERQQENEEGAPEQGQELVLEIKQYDIVELQLPEGEGSPVALDANKKQIPKDKKESKEEQRTSKEGAQEQKEETEIKEGQKKTFEKPGEAQKRVLASNEYAASNFTVEETKFESGENNQFKTPQVHHHHKLVEPSQQKSESLGTSPDKPILVEEVRIEIEPMVSKHPVHYIDRSNLQFDFVNPPQVVVSGAKPQPQNSRNEGLPFRQTAPEPSKLPDVPLPNSKPNSNPELQFQPDMPLRYVNQVKRYNLNEPTSDRLIGAMIQSQPAYVLAEPPQDTKQQSAERLEALQTEALAQKGSHTALQANRTNLKFDFISTPIYQQSEKEPSQENLEHRQSSQQQPSSRIVKAEWSSESIEGGVRRFTPQSGQPVVRYQLAEPLGAEYMKRISNESVGLDQYSFKPTGGRSSEGLAKEQEHALASTTKTTTQQAQTIKKVETQPPQVFRLVNQELTTVGQANGQTTKQVQSPVDLKQGQAQVTSPTQYVSVQHQTIYGQGNQTGLDQQRANPLISQFTNLERPGTQAFSTGYYSEEITDFRKAPSVKQMTQVAYPGSNIQGLVFRNDVTAKVEDGHTTIAQAQRAQKGETIVPQMGQFAHVSPLQTQFQVQNVLKAQEQTARAQVQIQGQTPNVALKSDTLRSMPSIASFTEPAPTTQKQLQTVIERPVEDLRNYQSVKSVTTSQPGWQVVSERQVFYRPEQLTTSPISSANDKRPETQSSGDSQSQPQQGLSRFDYEVLQTQEGSKRYILRQNISPSVSFRSEQAMPFPPQVLAQPTPNPQVISSVYQSNRSDNYSLSPINFIKTVFTPNQQEVVSEGRAFDFGYQKPFTSESSQQYESRRVLQAPQEMFEARSLNYSYQTGPQVQKAYVANSVRPSATFVNAIIPNIVPQKQK